MSLKHELAQMDEKLLEQLLSFASHLTNNTDSFKAACTELELLEHEGMPFVEILRDLGTTHSTKVKTIHDLADRRFELELGITMVLNENTCPKAGKTYRIMMLPNHESDPLQANELHDISECEFNRLKARHPDVPVTKT